MPTIDYKPIANGGGAIVESQAQYVTDLAGGGSLQNGYQNGVADPNQVNKTLRQSSMIAASVATFISNLLGIDVLDDGNLATLTANLTAAIGAEAIAAVGSGSLIVGQGNVQFQFSSVTTCLLKPHNGNSFILNGSNTSVPAAGLPLASSLLADNTDFNVYVRAFTSNITGAANNGGGKVRLTVGSTTDLATGYILNVTGVGGTVEANGANQTITVVDATHVDLLAVNFVNAYTAGGVLSGPILVGSVTAHTTATNGSEVKTGDSTQAWVGKVRLNGAAQFQQDATKWLVRSTFNDRGAALMTTGSATLSLMVMPNELVNVTAKANVNGNTGTPPGGGGTQNKIDGVAVGISGQATDISGGGDTFDVNAFYVGTATEGTRLFTQAVSSIGGAPGGTAAGQIVMTIGKAW